MSLTLLKESMKKAPIIKKGSYSYLIHPITDGIPEINPELLRDITQEMRNYIIKYLPIDKIVTMEAMGIPLATGLSLLLNIPFTVIRKRQYNLPDEKSIHQLTGYSKSNMFLKYHLVVKNPITIKRK